ncbi:hypothetical protein B0H15DRAFT_467114 [Mycena belliarum]|uniref:Uncharacterized protein n=1 Tax=Mycena belliarum TaxID=1033014 RepID=A0AAD6XMD4_9AGAR|nr:hypothetical protein B0H15DRAFT_467114 [Mycena belliae]
MAPLPLALSHKIPDLAAQIDENDQLLVYYSARHASVANTDLAAIFLSRILANMFLRAGRPVNEEIVSISSCVAILSSRPTLHNTLKLAHAEKNYAKVAESRLSHPTHSSFLLSSLVCLALIPPFVSGHVHQYLEDLRPEMQRLARGEKTLEYWSPSTDLEIDEETRRHIESLKLFCPDDVPEHLSIILHNLGSFKDDPVLHGRISRVFTPPNKFLVNASGTGKTRLLYEGLCLNWGFYFTVGVDSGWLGARDIEEALRDEFIGTASFRRYPAQDPTVADILKTKRDNWEFASRVFSTLLLARLLIFQQFLELAAADGLTEEHKKRWLLMQLSPSLLNPLERYGDTSPFEELPKKLLKEGNPYIHQDISDAFCKIRKLLGDAAHLFFILDEAQVVAKQFQEAFADGKPLITMIMRAWESHLAADHTLVFAGTDIPTTVAESTDAGDSNYVWCSGTGGFETAEAQERYVSSFLPSAFASSPSGSLLISRMATWLLGRHRSTASLMFALLSEGLQNPHTRFYDYIEEHTGLGPIDAVEQVISENRDPGRNWQNQFYSMDFSNIPAETKSIFLDVLYRYMATHLAPAPLGHEYLKLVNDGYARCIDSDLSRITIDEPLALVGAAVKLLPHPSKRPAEELYIPGHPNNSPETFLGSLRLNAPRSPQSFSHCLVFYLARIFSQPRSLAEVFNFPYKLPAWANQAAQLVKFHRGNSLEVEHTVVDPDDYSAPLATPTTSLEDTISWLEHEHGTAFCLPSSSSPDLLFALQLADESFVWVAMRAIPSTEPIPDSELKTAVSQLNSESLFDFEGADPSLHDRALTALQALPSRTSKVGKHSLFRVVAAFPAEVDLEGSVNKRARDAASLSLAALEGAEGEITQPAFFDSIVAGVLAGQKRKMSQVDEDAKVESRPKRQKTAGPASNGQAAPGEAEVLPMRDIASAAPDEEPERAASPKPLKTKGKARARPDEGSDDPTVSPKKKSKASPPLHEEPGKEKGRAPAVDNVERAVSVGAVAAPKSEGKAKATTDEGIVSTPRKKRGPRAQKASTSAETPGRHTRSKTRQQT